MIDFNSKNIRKQIHMFIGSEVYQSLIFLHNDYDKCIVGISEGEQLIYDYNKMVSTVLEKWKLDSIEAMVFVDEIVDETINSYKKNKPIFLFSWVKE